jgi:enoyl-CoA hydratase/carnithine racemase
LAPVADSGTTLNQPTGCDFMNCLQYEQRDGIGWLTLDRPDRLNAFTFEMWAEMRDLGSEVVADRSVKALVVIGAGRAFSSGIDLDTLSSVGAEEVWQQAALIQGAFTWLTAAPYPTVAAVRGVCFGGGFELALTCDLRVVTKSARLALPEVRLGLVPDLGGAIHLPRLVGPARAKDLIWTGREIDGEEAWRIGLADRLVDDAGLEEAAAGLADQLGELPIPAVTHAKRLVDAAGEMTVAEGLQASAEAVEDCVRRLAPAETAQSLDR